MASLLGAVHRGAHYSGERPPHASAQAVSAIDVTFASHQQGDSTCIALDALFLDAISPFAALLFAAQVYAFAVKHRPSAGALRRDVRSFHPARAPPGFV
jgi:hypothetical protein